MNRRDFVLAAAAAPALADAAVAHRADPDASLDVTGIAAAMAQGRMTSRRLTQRYLDRIYALNRRGASLNAVIEVNPRALDIAADLDAERASRGARGPLHGVPILIKDNIETSHR